MEELAKQHPIRGEFLRESIQAGLSNAESRGAFDDIIGIPMAPFRAIAGVESGAQAIHEFNATAAQFTEIVDQLPQRMRWQLELLSYDLQEQGGMLERSLDSFHLVAESANRLSLAAERLPDDTRDTILNVSTELEKRSATLKSLLAEYRGAMTETGATAGNVSSLVEALSRTSEQLNQAGVAWGELVATLRAPGPPTPPGQRREQALRHPRVREDGDRDPLHCRGGSRAARRHREVAQRRGHGHRRPTPARRRDPDRGVLRGAARLPLRRRADRAARVAATAPPP